MTRRRIKYATALGAALATMAIAVPIVTAAGSSEQPAPAGQTGDVALAETGSGGGGSVAAAPSPIEEAATPGGTGQVERASDPSGGDGELAATPGSMNSPLPRELGTQA